MNKRNISLISTIIGLCIFLIMAYGSSEDENNNSNTGYKNNYSTSSNYSSATSKSEHNLNKAKVLSVKKKIANIETQKREVKSFVMKIDTIEHPGTQSLNYLFKMFDYYQQGLVSPSDVIQSAKNIKRQCDNIMFSIGDLKVPNNLPIEIDTLLEKDKKYLTISWGIKGSTLNNIIDYFKDGNPNRIEYFKSDMQDANRYEMLALAKIMKAYLILGIPKEWGKNNKNEKDSIQKESNKNNSPSEQQVSPKPKIVTDTITVNNNDNKTKRQKRREERKRKRRSKKRKKN